MVTKYFIDKGADLDMHGSLFFEGAPQRPGKGDVGSRRRIVDFADKESREERRKLVMTFWQD
jgi:hypothetical protein